MSIKLKTATMSTKDNGTFKDIDFVYGDVAENIDELQKMLADVPDNYSTLVGDVEGLKTNVADLEDNKVDKVNGKGLSSNDFTDAKSAQIETNKTNISLLNDKIVFSDDTVTNATLPGGYNNGVTVSITGSDAKGFPLTYAIITTYKSGASRAYQICSSSGGKIYHRGGKAVGGNGEWDEWQQFALNSDLGKIFVRDDTVTINTLPSYFNKSVITYSRYDSNDSGGYGAWYAVITYSAISPTFQTMQIAYREGQPLKYRCSVVTSNESRWGAWHEIITKDDLDKLGNYAELSGQLSSQDSHVVYGYITAVRVGDKHYKISGSINIKTIDASKRSSSYFTVIPNTTILNLVKRINSSVTKITSVDGNKSGVWQCVYSQGGYNHAANSYGYGTIAYFNSTGLRFGRVYTEAGAIGAWPATQWCEGTNNYQAKFIFDAMCICE